MPTRRNSWLLLALLIAPGLVAARALHYGAVSDAAVLGCDAAAWRGIASEDCYRAILASSASPAAMAEAAWALGDIQAANGLFRDALRADSADLAALVRWGDLFSESHQDAEAMKIYREVLAADPDNAWAKLGAATVLADSFSAEAGEYLDAVLQANAPAGARAAAELLLARIQLENGAEDRARESLDVAARLIAEHGWPPLQLYALRAAFDLVQGSDASEWTVRALDYNPHWGNIHALPAHFLVITRRYRDAIALLQKAVDIEPGLAAAHEQLGMNLLRDNQVSRARRHLEIAYAEDPFSPLAVNALRLLDSFSNFRVLNDDGGDGEVPVMLRLHKDEADVIAPYAISLIRDSIAEFTPRYGFALREPVVVEMYPHHEDFAVRTAGMPGLGILGATFGYVIAMDSPSGRSAAEFQWGTTLWHEMAHVFTLEATAHRVPRWFSEGVSVFEEWRSGPSRGVQIPLPVLGKMQEGAFLPVLELDEGFIRPRYEEQVIVSYMQAGLLCRFIEQAYGTGKLAAMLVAWRDGAETAAVVEQALGVSAEQLDAAFAESIEVEFSAQLANMHDWSKQREQLAAEIAARDWNAVIELAPDVIALMPDYIATDSPYIALAAAQSAVGETDAARVTLTTFWQKGGFEPEALRELAELTRNVDVEMALRVYANINMIAPLDADWHAEYGELLLGEGHAIDALREFEVAMALRPHDMAAAWYRLATAHAALGDKPAAQSRLLEALDIAPNYRPAQKLLLELAGSKELKPMETTQ